MILLIDYGNTRIKWRLLEPSGCFQEGYCSSASLASFAELSAHGDVIDRVAISMVGSVPAMESLRNTLQAITPAPIQFYWAESERNGLRNAYTEPERMGADRWHAMVGAWTARQAGVAVIDAGSALTVDYIKADGRHLGGYILPGIRMMRQSLHQGAARVDSDDTPQAKDSPGRNTSECVNHGLSWLMTGVIERINQDVHEFGLEAVVVTGGDGKRYRELGLAGEYRPGLVFEGLALVDQGEAGP